VPRAAESSRARGNTVDGSSAARVQTRNGRARAPNCEQVDIKSGRRGTFGPGSFSVPESPNRRVEEGRRLPVHRLRRFDPPFAATHIQPSSHATLPRLPLSSDRLKQTAVRGATASAG
jgi:hypothetical protein